MSFIRKHTVEVTTDSSENADKDTGEVVNGRVLAIIFDIGDMTTPNVDITGADTGIVIVDKDSMGAGTYYPRVVAVGTDLAAIFYEGANAVVDTVPIANEPINIAIASGGATKTGTFTFIIG